MLPIIDRIRKSLAGGALREKPPDKTREVKTIGGLMQAWEDAFPGFGVSDLQEVSLRPHYNFRFRSVPRRSKLPLEPPKTIENPPKLISPTLFLSVQAVWEYYREIDKADQALLELPFTDQGVGKFVEPLFDVVEDYYPLFGHLENIENVATLHCLSLWLPCYSYEEENAFAVEAFLSGPADVAGMLTHLDDEYDLNLSRYYRTLIKTVGYPELTKFYADFAGDKLCNLKKLENWQENYFQRVIEQYPAVDTDRIAIISGDSPTEITIQSVEDIRFAIDWAKAYYALDDDMPPTWLFIENEEEEIETFVRDICRVWRKGHKK
jgi:hypothetical protein